MTKSNRLLWRNLTRNFVLPVALEWMTDKNFVGISLADICSHWEAPPKIQIPKYLPSYHKRIELFAKTNC